MSHCGRIALDNYTSRLRDAGFLHYDLANLIKIERSGLATKQQNVWYNLTRVATIGNL